jgi:hypothetical protein
MVRRYIFVHRANLADVVPGQIVEFARNRHFVTHRVVRRIVKRNASCSSRAGMRRLTRTRRSMRRSSWAW